MENVYLYLMHESEDAITKNKRKYAKKDIGLLSNFDTDRHVASDIEGKEEMSNDVCDMIDDHGLADIRGLRHLMKEHGSDYNLPSMKTINSALCSHTGLIGLYFDAVYQEHEYGQSCADAHTGGIKK